MRYQTTLARLRLLCLSINQLAHTGEPAWLLIVILFSSDLGCDWCLTLLLSSFPSFPLRDSTHH